MDRLYEEDPYYSDTKRAKRNDGFHLRKAWDRSIEEEVESLTTEVDEHTKRIRDMANHEFLIR
ncbi:unnamed protein product [Arabis nemorensis]|uniref:Uncharacterized protein n=1 Tax=Arabis nemorensis TaxID=586526 RepID=A0A565AVA4_9BRAS|nr:unnamed protein product [Arabis nemorensis]